MSLDTPIVEGSSAKASSSMDSSSMGSSYKAPIPIAQASSAKPPIAQASMDLGQQPKSEYLGTSSPSASAFMNYQEGMKIIDKKVNEQKPVVSNKVQSVVSNTSNESNESDDEDINKIFPSLLRTKRVMDNSDSTNADWEKVGKPRRIQKTNKDPRIVLKYPARGFIGHPAKIKRGGRFTSRIKTKKNKQKHRQTKKKTNKRRTVNRRMVKKHRRQTYKKR
jgi:hypothetical protein